MGRTTGLDGLRVRVHRVERDLLTVRTRRPRCSRWRCIASTDSRMRPNRLRRVGAVVLHLLDVPAGADPQHEPAVRDHVEAGCFLRGVDGVALDHECAMPVATFSVGGDRMRPRSAPRTGRACHSTSAAAPGPPGHGDFRLAGMWLCSATHSDSKPRCLQRGTRARSWAWRRRSGRWSPRDACPQSMHDPPPRAGGCIDRGPCWSRRLWPRTVQPTTGKATMAEVELTLDEVNFFDPEIQDCPYEAYCRPPRGGAGLARPARPGCTS